MEGRHSLCSGHPGVHPISDTHRQSPDVVGHHAIRHVHVIGVLRAQLTLVWRRLRALRKEASVGSGSSLEDKRTGSVTLTPSMALRMGVNRSVA